MQRPITGHAVDLDERSEFVQTFQLTVCYLHPHRDTIQYKRQRSRCGSCSQEVSKLLCGGCSNVIFAIYPSESCLYHTVLCCPLRQNKGSLETRIMAYMGMALVQVKELISWQESTCSTSFLYCDKNSCSISIRRIHGLSRGRYIFM